MNKGESINGYTINGVGKEIFTTKNAGYCRWTFVEKDGMQYFMKEFLYPTFPIDNCPKDLKTKREAQCDVFEKYHRTLMEKIQKEITNSTSLIHTLDFFRHGSRYYKITKRVEISNHNIEGISKLSLATRLNILSSIAKGLEVLHRLNIVHGDLKHDNILVVASGDGSLSARLIDYDNSYLSGKPPITKNIVGDLIYFSPEMENYVLGLLADGTGVTEKSDIFALGILFCLYLTGKFPSPNSPSKYVSNIVNNGTRVQINTEGISPYLPSKIVELVNQMLLKATSSRPSIYDVLSVLERNSGKRPVQIGRLIINMSKTR